MMRVMFTNYNDHNSVNKRASLLFFETPGFFTNHSIQKNSHLYVEKSTRNVYDAIALDFGDVHS
jgi:hypothetical protein